MDVQSHAHSLFKGERERENATPLPVSSRSGTFAQCVDWCAALFYMTLTCVSVLQTQGEGNADLDAVCRRYPAVLSAHTPGKGGHGVVVGLGKRKGRDTDKVSGFHM